MPKIEKEQADSVVSFGLYRVDLAQVRVWRGVHEVKLTGKAFGVLQYFVAHPGQLVTKDALFEAVWPQTVVTESTLASCIQELRQALRDDAKKPRYIETVHRRGYRFIAPLNTPLPHGSRAEIRGPNQEDGGSIASAGGGRPEEEGRRQEPSTNGQPVGSVFSTLQLPLGQAPAGIQESDADPAEPTPWMPVSASMTPPSTASQLPPLSPPPPQVPDSSALSVRRSWVVRNRVVLVLILLVGGILTVRYLARPLLSPPDAKLGPQQAPPTLALPDKPSIIVLPFVNLSGDPGQEYFSDGVTTDITNTLSRLSSLFVISRMSAFTYKHNAAKVRDISREMGVQYVLEGSVRKTAEQVRIEVDLIDATTDRQLWAEQYDRPFTNIFEVQDEIVQRIVTTLNLQLTLWEQGVLVRKRTNSLEAYDLYLRGLESLFRVASETKKEENAHARQMFAKAVELDPTYAEAYVGLSWTYFYDWFYQSVNDRAQALEQAFAIAQRAVALDDSLPGAHQLLGHIYVWKRQYEQATAEGQQAIILDPNDAEGYVRLGTILIFAGQPEKAVSVIEKSIRLNPRSLFYFNALGLAQIAAGRYEEALASLKKLLTRNPNMMIAHMNIAICYVELGRLEEARAAGAEVMRLNPNWSLDFIRHAPWKDQAIIERHIAALRKAGLKEGLNTK